MLEQSAKHRRRALIRQILVNNYPAPLLPNKKIAVVGLPRSGTSWLAKAISMVDGVSYYFEPDSQLDGKYWHKYLAEGDVDDVLSAHIKASLAGKITDEYVIAEQGLRELLLKPFSSTILVKYVKMSYCMNWFAYNFPDVTVVQIIRHPIPLFLSWKKRDWDPGFALKCILNQKSLLDGPLNDHVETLLSASSYWEKAAAFWSATALMQHAQQTQNYYILSHEWLCSDSITNYKSVIDDLGLTWNSHIENFLSGKSLNSGPGYGKWRDPSSELRKWENEVSVSDMKRIDEIIGSFNIPFNSRTEI